jgi:putative FmdB family regulatory protein
MPIYEYMCLDCGTKFEILRSMKDADNPVLCEECEGEHTSRQLSVFFAQSGGRVVTATGSGCSSCSGGSCASCGH